MSEFTSGHLLLASHKESIRKHAIPGSLIKELDDKWVAYLTRNDNYLEYQEAPYYIYQLSNDAPALNFCNFSDHFWGYRIFSKGKEIAYLRISYEFSEEIIIEVLKSDIRIKRYLIYMAVCMKKSLKKLLKTVFSMTRLINCLTNVMFQHLNCLR